MGAIRWIAGLGTVLLLTSILAAAEPAAKESPANPGKAMAEATAFEMAEFSLLDETAADLKVRGQLLYGQFTALSDSPFEEVKAYPRLNSKRPMYGAVSFNLDLFHRDDAVTRYFVVDEADQAESPEAKTSPLLEGIAAAVSGKSESPKPKAKYNRLYFDVNGDKDLTNDPAVGIMNDPPELLDRSDNLWTFDCLEVPFDHGPGLGLRPVRIIPRLRWFDENRGFAEFLVPSARRGQIRLGDREYTAILAQAGTVTGRFDQPRTTLRLLPKGEQNEAGESLSSWLSVMPEIDGRFYELSATPLGDRLFVKPYQGPMGSIEIKPGKRSVDPCVFCGGLFAENRVVYLGKAKSRYEREKAARFEIPTGDYQPSFLSVAMGRARITLRPNTYREGDPHPHDDQPANCTIHIREGESFVFDFQTKPKVLFTKPAQDQVVQPGETVAIQAVLVEPAMNLMVGSIQNTTQEDRALELRDEDGNEVKILQYKQVHPQVVIRDASGKQVAQGEMPFG